jgi:hypothetical protein
MDGFHFDALTRTLTSAGSRRRALTGLLGGTVGLFAAWADEAAAKNCKKIRNKKKRKRCLARARGCVSTCAGKRCGDDGCAGSCGACGGGRICDGGQCICPGGLTDCGDVCRNTQTNEAHCGGCGNPCDVAETCCSGSCVTTQTDEMHCGECGNGCDRSETCCSGRCVNTQSNDDHCGACDNDCTGNTVCQTGACFPRSICPVNADLCPGPNIVCNSSGSPACECVTSTEDTTFCATAVSFCVTLTTTCTTSGDCGSGEACVDVSGCCGDPLPEGTKTCMSPCQDPQPF